MSDKREYPLVDEKVWNLAEIWARGEWPTATEEVIHTRASRLATAIQDAIETEMKEMGA